MKAPSRSLIALPVLAALVAAAVQDGAKPAPAADDAQSPDSLSAAMYSLLSGPPGQTRDWARFRDLFLEGARVITIDGPDSAPIRKSMSVDDFILAEGPTVVERGFSQREVSHEDAAFRAIAHRFATTEWSFGDDDGDGGGQSKVSTQFVHDGKRWWIASVLSQPTTDTSAGGPAITAEARKAALQVFRTACFTCHGIAGKGDGPAAVALDPKPRNYTDPQWQASISDEEIRKAILEGVIREDGKPSLMLPQKAHFIGRPEGTIDAMVELIRSFAK